MIDLIVLILIQIALNFYFAHRKNNSPPTDLENSDFLSLLNRLKKADKTNRYRKVFLMLRFQFNENEKEYLKGITPIEEYRLIKRQLYFKLLKLQENLPP